MGEKDKAERMLENYADVFADIVNVLMFGGKRLISPMNWWRWMPDPSLRRRAENSMSRKGTVPSYGGGMAGRWRCWGWRIRQISMKICRFVFSGMKEPDIRVSFWIRQRDSVSGQHVDFVFWEEALEEKSNARQSDIHS